jgi:RNA polymerase sigma factor (sigma-70 family)
VNTTLEGPEGPDPERRPTVAPDPPPEPTPGEDSSPAPAEPTPAAPAGRDEFTAFYTTAVPRLVAFLRWQGAPLPDAADCVQEAMAQCYPGWSGIDSPYTWCRVVASRLYARRVARVLEDAVEDLERAGPPLLAADMDIAEFEQRHDFLRLLDQLPARQRQVLAWTYDGATPTEIAKSLRITPDAVRASLMKARATLRLLLWPEGGDTA